MFAVNVTKSGTVDVIIKSLITGVVPKDTVGLVYEGAVCENKISFETIVGAVGAVELIVKVFGLNVGKD